MDSRSVPVAWSSSLCGEPRCCFIFVHVFSRTVCVAQLQIRQLVWTLMYTVAIIEKPQQHQWTKKASLQGRFGCLHPYQPSFHVPPVKVSLIIQPLWELELQKGSSDVYLLHLWTCGNRLLFCICPSVWWHPFDFHRAQFEGQFNGPFVFCIRLASVEASKQSGSDAINEIFFFMSQTCH